MLTSTIEKCINKNSQINKEKLRDRSSNFELLRIILILMVIILHYCNPLIGGAIKEVKPFSVNYWIIHFVQSASIVAVNVFILLTGYFSNEKKKIKVNKVVSLLYLTIIWSILIFVGMILFNKINITDNINVFILSFIDRWFVLAYSVLYLLIPYINKLIYSINKKQFSLLLIILVICFYIWPTLGTNTIMKDNGYGITNFVVLYFIGAYIKLYFDDFKSFWKSGIIYILYTLATTLFGCITEKAFDYNSIFNLIASIALFEMFKAINIKNSKIVNKLATFTFSTYIIHENPLIATIIYQDLFNLRDYYSKYLFINLIITTLGIYVGCIILEYIRRLIMQKYIDKKVEKIKYTISV